MRTVSGTILDAKGQGRPSCKVTFTPVNAPAIDNADSAAIITSPAVSATTNVAGYFSINLKPGDYTVLIDAADSFTIAVPTQAGSSTIGSLIVEALYYVPSSVSAPSGYAEKRNQPVTGSRDGSNMNFSVPDDYVAGSLCVYYGTGRLTPGSGNDFIETGNNTFSTYFAPPPDSVLLADYLTVA